MDEANKASKLPWVIVGILVVALIGGGIYVYRDMNQTKAAQASARQQRAALRNPAIRAAMSLLSLQRDPQQALTADQKKKLVPILTDLVNTKQPSLDFLRKQADAINAVLTDAQRNYITSNQQSSGARRWNGGNGYGGNRAGGNGFSQGQGGSNRQGFNPATLYQRVLDSLK